MPHIDTLPYFRHTLTPADMAAITLDYAPLFFRAIDAFADFEPRYATPPPLIG